MGNCILHDALLDLGAAKPWMQLSSGNCQSAQSWACTAASIRLRTSAPHLLAHKKPAGLALRRNRHLGGRQHTRHNRARHDWIRISGREPVPASPLLFQLHELTNYGRLACLRLSASGEWVYPAKSWPEMLANNTFRPLRRMDLVP